jgi:anti-sigma B factor antagonist
MMRRNDFDWKQEERDGITVFTLKGNFNVGVSSKIRLSIEPLLSTGQRKVLFDLSGLEQLDSAGVTTLIVIFKRVRSNKGDMKITGLSGQPREIFRLLRLDKVFDIHEEFEAAIGSF